MRTHLNLVDVAGAKRLLGNPLGDLCQQYPAAGEADERQQLGLVASPVRHPPQLKRLRMRLQQALPQQQPAGSQARRVRLQKVENA